MVHSEIKKLVEYGFGKEIISNQERGSTVASIFDIIPNNFFNPLSSNSNYRANAALFQFIYEQYDNEISYRIKRNILRDEMAYFISEHSEEFLADYDMSNKTCQDISSDYLRRFSSKDVQ